MDLFPTLCEAANLPPPSGVEGVSFLPALLGNRQPPPERDLYFVRREGGLAYGGKTIEALIRGQWKILQDNPFTSLELYHLASDPYETTDLAGREPERLKALNAALRLHIQAGGQVPWQAAHP